MILIVSLSTEKLDLSQNNALSGSIPDVIYVLQNITSLRLSNTLVSSNFPADISLMSNLKEFEAAGCFFVGTLPKDIGSLVKLRKLDLRRNAPLTGVLPTELGLLTSLEYLLLSHNEFSGQIPTELGAITSLKEVQLGKNSFGKTLATSVPAEICSLKGASAAFSILVTDCDLANVTCDCCSSCITADYQNAIGGAL